MRKRHLARIVGVALGYGFVAGALAGLTYAAMHHAQVALWSRVDPRWTFLVIFGAGCLIAALSRQIGRQSLDEQIASAQDLRSFHRGRGLLLALSAFVAVVAGGAIGPEAGIIALVTELSALVTLRIREAQMKAFITEVGIGSALGALYASPPAGAVYETDSLPRRKLINVASAIFGFIGFLAVARLTHVSGIHIDLPTAVFGDLQSWLVLVAAGAVGAVFAVAYNWVDHYTARWVSKLPTVPVILVGSAALAALLTAFPHLRFSGQDELAELSHFMQFAPAALLLMVVLKSGAVLLTLRSGWRGGTIFPQFLIASLLGFAVALLFAPQYAAVGAVAAIGALLTGTSRKPLVVALLAVFVLPSFSYLALLGGILIGMVATAVSPPQTAH